MDFRTKMIGFLWTFVATMLGYAIIVGLLYIPYGPVPNFDVHFAGVATGALFMNIYHWFFKIDKKKKK